MTVDTYTAAEAATVIGISERRVRQLAAAQSLDVVDRNPLRLSRSSVHAARKRRRPSTVAAAVDGTSSAPPVEIDVREMAREIAAAVVAEMLPKALEARDKVAADTEQRYVEALAAAHARIAEMEIKLQQATAATERTGWRRMFGG